MVVSAFCKVFGKIENRTPLELEFVHDILGFKGRQQVMTKTSKYSFPLEVCTLLKFYHLPFPMKTGSQIRSQSESRVTN